MLESQAKASWEVGLSEDMNIEIYRDIYIYLDDFHELTPLRIKACGLWVCRRRVFQALLQIQGLARALYSSLILLHLMILHLILPDRAGIVPVFPALKRIRKKNKLRVRTALLVAPEWGVFFE